MSEQTLDQWLVVEISDASLAMRGIGAKFPRARVVFVGTGQLSWQFISEHRAKHGHQFLLSRFVISDETLIDAAMHQDKVNGTAFKDNDARAMRLQLQDPFNK